MFWCSQEVSIGLKRKVTTFAGPRCLALPIHRCQKTSSQNRTRDFRRTRKTTEGKNESTLFRPVGPPGVPFEHYVPNTHNNNEDWAVLPRSAYEAIQESQRSYRHVHFTRPCLRNSVNSQTESCNGDARPRWAHPRSPAKDQPGVLASSPFKKKPSGAPQHPQEATFPQRTYQERTTPHVCVLSSGTRCNMWFNSKERKRYFVPHRDNEPYSAHTVLEVSHTY